MEMKQSSLNQTIYEKIHLPENAWIADLGCRNAGYLNGIIQTFPGKVARAVGADVTDKNFSAVPCLQQVELKVMDCSKVFDLEDHAFDLVFAKDLLECIPDKTAFVKEINRILKPGGTVICVNADFDSTIYNGENKDLITKVIHAYAVTKQGWMEDIDSWMGRRTYGVFHNSGFFESSLWIHNVVETEYTRRTVRICVQSKYRWLVGESTEWVTGKNTWRPYQAEYDEFIRNLVEANRLGTYLYVKPYYIYKGIKKK